METGEIAEAPAPAPAFAKRRTWAPKEASKIAAMMDSIGMAEAAKPSGPRFSRANRSATSVDVIEQQLVDKAMKYLPHSSSTDDDCTLMACI